MARVALIEDHRATSDKHRDILNSIDGVVVSQAFTYSEAVQLISQAEFDLLVVDIDLGGSVPGQYEGFDILRDFGTKITTIVVTGMAEENLHAFALKLKAYEFINKPVTPVDLVNKARHALGFDHRPPEKQTAWPEGLELDAKRAPHVSWKKNPIDLTLTELTIVHQLANHAGETVEHRKLAKALDLITDKVPASHILGVRKKFLAVDRSFDQIQSDPTLGYYWKLEK
jgi:DNA-binding response OmpR family regulator